MESALERAAPNGVQLLNFGELRKKLGGRARSTIYNDIAAGRLPKPIKLGGRLYWLESSIQAWLESRVEAGS